MKAETYYYVKGAPGEKYYYKILAILRKRLSYEGKISLPDAWVICRNTYGYQMVQQAFRCIMLEMVEQGKAVALGPGKYKITNPDPYEGPEPRETMEQRHADVYLPEPIKLGDPDKWPRRIAPFYSNVYKTYLNV